MGETNFFLSTLSFNPWAVSATWLCVGAPQKIRKNEHAYFNKNSPQAHTELEFDVLGIHGKLVKYVCSSLVQKKKLKKIIFLHTSCPNSNRPVFGLKEF
jgi:hypothetical protein